MARQPKYDYLKQLSGRSISTNESPRQRRSNYRGHSNHRQVSLTDSQQMVLQRVFNQELALYNNFLTPMQALLKGMPEFYGTLSERHKELFAKMTRIKFDIRSIFIKKSKRVELPELLEPYRDILFGISDGVESGISEQLAIFLEMCRHTATLLPDTRECMAREFFKFYVSQTKVFENTQILEELNSMQKRHVQIRKPFVDVVWLPTKHVTKIRIPYLQTPIIMHSDINDLPQWNMIIIHKDPAQLDLGKTDLNWEIDFRQTDETYLLKYIETPNPISKMESRFIKR